MPTRRSLALPTLLALVGVAATGCGSDDSSSGSTTAASTAAGAASTAQATTPAASADATAASDGRLTVDASEFEFAPTAATAKAGRLTITMKNLGKVPHELVLLKTSTKADGLKVTDGRVSEADSVGEISETDGGVSKDHTFTLKAGTYVYVCNIPGHYMDGMRGTLTVQ
jgi:plastocyanin